MTTPINRNPFPIPKSYGLRPNGEAEITFVQNNNSIYGPEEVEGQKSTAFNRKQIMQSIANALGCQDNEKNIKDIVAEFAKFETAEIKNMALTELRDAKSKLTKLNIALKEVDTKVCEELTGFAKEKLNSLEATLSEKCKEVTLEEVNKEVDTDKQITKQSLDKIKLFFKVGRNAIEGVDNPTLELLANNVELCEKLSNVYLEVLGINNRTELESMAEMLKEIKNTNAVPESVEKEET